ncbi:DNA-binding transcriptional regulator, LysR family [Oribacterium sp. KHPX15]|uniref:LysR family transcriptional regulator n=1 Tax=Oribacterium sp. KHPX15 TaxID=1855342 RepID=UPI00089AB0A1|nr:LysR family transcriptional regulator [Oribacterium sp. KHPX15]SEA72538.1 DNA-binding transcriptional regulator, LysR family [Oribacterium sp. KHPX15]
MITIKQMTYFLSVCKTQNLSRSALELYVSQPTLSVTIKELEEETSAQLFTRKGSRLSLTEAGRRLRDEMKKVMDQYDRMNSMINSGILTRDCLRLGYSTIIGSEAIPLIYKSFTEKNPSIHLEITEGAGWNLLQKLDEEELDAVLTVENYMQDKLWEKRFSTKNIKASLLEYCVSRNSPLASKETITLEEISREPLILFDHNFPLSDTIEKIFSIRGYNLDVRLRSSQIFMVSRFIEEGLGGGFLPASACRDHVNLVPIECPELSDSAGMEARVYWKKHHVANKPLEQFLEFLNTKK